MATEKKNSRMSKFLDIFRRDQPWPWLIGVIVVYILYFCVIWGTELPAGWKRGQFGDSFGAISALFAGLAFAGVIWAILLQQRELGLQREELGLQRKNVELQRKNLKTQQEILRVQRRELQEQRKTLQKQNFESSFFQLFGLHNDIVNSIEFNRTNNLNQLETHLGRRFFIYALNQLKEEEVPYQTFFDNHQKHVGHYFFHLYNVIRFVDQSEIIEKKLYTRLIRDQLSTDELGVLFYHGLSEPGAEFKAMIEKYALFEYLRPVLQNRQAEKYATSAYGESD